MRIIEEPTIYQLMVDAVKETEAEGRSVHSIEVTPDEMEEILKLAPPEAIQFWPLGDYQYAYKGYIPFNVTA